MGWTDMRTTRPITLELDAETIAFLRGVSERRGISIEDAARDALRYMVDPMAREFRLGSGRPRLRVVPEPVD